MVRSAAAEQSHNARHRQLINPRAPGAT